jgi:hypothetical protein
MNTENNRLEEARKGGAAWKKWGPYLSERQWGTVREDYSENGDAWNFFTHDHARSRAYRWGEDGLAGISDDQQQLCFALALWNGKDAILKERLFGLTNSEGNHGEDVKEYYFYLDSTPTHSYMKYLYKYPQAAFPYADLVETNRRRNRNEMEYELLDTGVFNDDRYFDVFVEYAKGGAEDILVQITAFNRGPKEAELHLLPTLWFRNDWATWIARRAAKPNIKQIKCPVGTSAVAASHPVLGEYALHCEGEVPLLFTENETNNDRLFPEHPNASPYVKDGINNCVVLGQRDAVNPDRRGTKVALYSRLKVPPGESARIRLRLTGQAPGGESRKTKATASPFGTEFDETLAARLREADEFYRSVTPPSVSPDEANVMRQAIAGMLWSKQYYFFDGDQWLDEHRANPLHPGSREFRNRDWFHMVNEDVISMPDKWEYPWYAAWDLAFHTLPISIVDPEFAKEQMKLMLRGVYLHPSGQIPAYEWNFSDVNPPVHAWALSLAHGLERQLAGSGTGDAVAEGNVDFLAEAFGKLLLNFTWWVNRKDPSGRNVFQGGFLGLDNIGVFDRSMGVPSGGTLEQSDGTAWMAFFSQSMLELAIALSEHDPAYEGFIVKFVHHWFQIAMAMDPLGDHPDEMWDDEDGFFYDVLRLPDGTGRRIEVRSLVGLLPLCATSVLPQATIERFPRVIEQIRTYLDRNGDLLAGIADPRVPGVDGRRLLALVDEGKLRRILESMLDEDKFLGPHGIRSVSKQHEAEPYVFELDGATYTVAYQPAESDSGMFGGNSNWRGPVWFPINVLLVRALLQFYLYYGDDFRIECPTGSGEERTLYEVAELLSDRLVSTFTRDADGRRPVFGETEKFQTDPTWSENVLFYEYFHGDNGAGIGASHQTGWTGVVARLAQLFASTDSQTLLHGADRPLTVPYRHLMDQPPTDGPTAHGAR